MIYLLLIAIYIASYFLCWGATRLCSSKHYGFWSDERCKFTTIWLIPVFNTLYGLIMFLCTLNDIIKEHHHLPKSKWLNTDL